MQEVINYVQEAIYLFSEYPIGMGLMVGLPVLTFGALGITNVFFYLKNYGGEKRQIKDRERRIANLEETMRINDGLSRRIARDFLDSDEF